MKILGIKFAPLNVPLKRRLETLAVTVWFFTMCCGPVLSCLIVGYLLLFTTIMRYFVLLYFLWMCYDWDTCNKGGRRIPLLPSYSFRKTDIYDQVRNPCFAWVQQCFYKILGYAPLILKGRGFFQYSYGFIPHRVPITTVVDSPFEIPKISHPTKEQINEYHKQFVEKLTELFETYKYMLALTQF